LGNVIQGPWRRSVLDPNLKPSPLSLAMDRADAKYGTPEWTKAFKEAIAEGEAEDQQNKPLVMTEFPVND
jgi:hypothetical protein